MTEQYDSADLLAACLAFESQHGAASLIIALSEILEMRREANGIEVYEDEDGDFELCLPPYQ